MVCGCLVVGHRIKLQFLLLWGPKWNGNDNASWRTTCGDRTAGDGNRRTGEGERIWNGHQREHGIGIKLVLVGIRRRIGLKTYWDHISIWQVGLERLAESEEAVGYLRKGVFRGVGGDGDRKQKTQWSNGKIIPNSNLMRLEHLISAGNFLCDSSSRNLYVRRDSFGGCKRGCSLDKASLNCAQSRQFNWWKKRRRVKEQKNMEKLVIFPFFSKKKGRRWQWNMIFMTSEIGKTRNQDSGFKTKDLEKPVSHWSREFYNSYLTERRRFPEASAFEWH